MNSHIPDDLTSKKNLILRRMCLLLLQLVFGMSILIILSGDVFYVGAWILCGLYITSYVFFLIYLPKEVIKRRSQTKNQTLFYEKLLKILFLALGYSVYVIAALDRKNMWTNQMPWYMIVISCFIFLVGMGIVLWSMRENPYFDVALQKDESHPIIESGPYAVIRHPGYLGMITYLTVVPVILNSLYAMIPTLVIIGLFLIRTRLEDDYLMNHVEEYKLYQQKVTKRLFRSYKS
ncbi:MAG: hypothetical protein A2Y45_09925 [Tenericutes bacterium GWC2_34_14]|nr:MAG: hypothetical protein A2Y45_09925 [Tenericutes bacterium GWC2_34_14]OHE42759.1 MAG: hypothetical protein A2221_08625 [Tenericutes bacterium RIFOXYA2_FULL_36_32]